MSWQSIFQSQADNAATAAGIDPTIFSNLIASESSFNPYAYNYNNGGTPAIGIAQFQPGTASQMGVDPWDATSSLNGAAQYLAQLLSKYGGNMNQAIAAYKGYSNVNSPSAQAMASSITNVSPSSIAASVPSAPDVNDSSGYDALGNPTNSTTPNSGSTDSSTTPGSNTESATGFFASITNAINGVKNFFTKTIPGATGNISLFVIGILFIVLVVVYAFKQPLKSSTKSFA
jgi:hypothetical protein